MRTLQRLALPSAVVILASSLALDAEAQAPTSSAATAGCTYATCAVRVEAGWFSERILRGAAGEEVGTLGIFGGGVDVLKAGSDSASAHTASYTENVRQSVPMLVATIVAFGIAASKEKTPSGGFSNGAVAFGIAGVVAGLASAAFTVRARRELSRAIWWYNAALPR